MIKTFYFAKKMEKEFNTLPMPHKDDGDNGHTAHVYLLGQNKKGIIDTAIKVKANGGCHWLPRLSTEEITISNTALLAANRDWCGVLRIVKDKPDDNDGGLIYGLLKLGKSPDFCMMSVGISKQIKKDVPNDMKRKFLIETMYFDNKGNRIEHADCRYEFV